MSSLLLYLLCDLRPSMYSQKVDGMTALLLSYFVVRCATQRQRYRNSYHEIGSRIGTVDVFVSEVLVTCMLSPKRMSQLPDLLHEVGKKGPLGDKGVDNSFVINDYGNGDDDSADDYDR